MQTGVANAPLYALRTAVDGYDGVYVFASGGVFPNKKRQATTSGSTSDS